MDTLAEATFTDFLRNPNAVTELLKGGDVILHRRGADDLRLTVASRATSIEASLETIGRLITAVLQDGVVRERIGRQAPLPWLSFLPQAARERFYVELFECIDGAGSLGTLAPIARLLDEWHATAQVYADPDLAARLSRPLPGDGGPVKRPDAP
jgi:hypothetical protein